MDAKDRATVSATATSDDKQTEVVLRLPNPMNMFPDEFWSHMRASWREQLLAARCLIDAAIERSEERPSRARSRVDIKVD